MLIRGLPEIVTEELVKLAAVPKTVAPYLTFTLEISLFPAVPTWVNLRDLTSNPSIADVNCNVATCCSTLPAIGLEAEGVANMSAVNVPTACVATDL